MKRFLVPFVLIIVFVQFVAGQTLEEKLKEIDDYAKAVMATHGGPGMAIAVVKDDRVVFQKGYGVKTIVSSPSASYAKLYQAVKAKDVDAIRQMMSKKTQEFAESIASRQNVNIVKVYENGFTATTFSTNLPAMRDERIAGQFGAVEVLNEDEDKKKEELRKAGVGYGQISSGLMGQKLRKATEDARRAELAKSSWDELPFVFEDGEWKLAIGDLFAGTFKSPGKSISTLEREKHSAVIGVASKKNSKTNVPQSPQIPTSKPLESPFVDENTVFAIASNSKAFTTAALAILIDEKKLTWDDKVSKFLPDLQLYDPWVTSELTVRDLVTHRVGLDTFSGDLLWYETTYKPDEILARVRYLPKFSSFRTRFGYQNLMFIAAGKVVEKVSGKPWCQFITERILTPLDMKRTVCSINNLPDNAAWPHNESGGKLRVLHRGNVDGSYSAAALNSSVADLSKWVRTQLGKGKFEGKQVFSEAQNWQMHQQWLAQQVGPSNAPGVQPRHFSGVGMGWFVYDYYGRKIVNHSGGLDGMLSYTVLIPEENAGFVVLTNSEGPGFAIMMNKIRDVLVNAPKRDYNAEAAERTKRDKTEAEAEIKRVDATRVPNTKPTLALSAYAGTYSDKMYGDITVSEENGKLVMRFLPSPNFVADLEPWHFDTWVIKWRPSVAYNFPRGFVTFTIDKNGRPDEMKIDQPNNDFWFYELHPKRAN